MYDFDTNINRSGTASIKWQRRPEWIKEKGYPAMSVADMEFRSAPEIVARMTKAAEFGMYGYTDPDDTYYDALTGWLQRKHGYSVQKEEIVCAEGVIPSITLAVQEFTNEGDEIVIQTPVYYPFSAIIRSNHRKIAENRLIMRDGAYTIDFDDLEQKLKKDSVKMMILSNPHNPVGRVYTREELLQISALCLKHHVLVIADEIHFDLVYKPHKHIVFASLGDEAADNTIMCTAPSKTFNLAGLYNAYVVIKNKELRERFQKAANRNGHSNISLFGYNATIAAYNEGEKWLEALLEYLEGNYNLFKSFMADNLPMVKVFDLQGTYLVWTDFRKIEPDRHKLERFMIDQCGLILDEGYIFGKEAEGFERFNIALPRKALQEALDRLYENVRQTYL